MALYTIFAWTAVVIVAGAYYWIYIRKAPLSSHLLGVTSSPHSRDSTVEGLSVRLLLRRKSGNARQGVRKNDQLRRKQMNFSLAQVE